MSLKKKEYFYQDFLERHLCGSHCRFKYGQTDVSTDNIHAEIKEFNKWKNAFGQLLYYNHVSPRSDLRIYLYGKPKRYDASSMVSCCQEYNITPFILSYDGENVFMEKLC